MLHYNDIQHNKYITTLSIMTLSIINGTLYRLLLCCSTIIFNITINKLSKLALSIMVLYIDYSYAERHYA
jgi:hypothetical protein